MAHSRFLMTRGAELHGLGRRTQGGREMGRAEWKLSAVGCECAVVSETLGVFAQAFPNLPAVWNAGVTASPCGVPDQQHVHRPLHVRTPQRHTLRIHQPSTTRDMRHGEQPRFVGRCAGWPEHRLVRQPANRFPRSPVHRVPGCLWSPTGKARGSTASSFDSLRSCFDPSTSLGIVVSEPGESNHDNAQHSP